MKRFYLIVLIIVLLRSEFVKTKETNDTKVDDVSEITETTERDGRKLPSTQFIPRPRPNLANESHAESLVSSQTTSSDCHCNVTIYLMSSTIIILCFIVIGLVLFIYKLKKKAYSDYDDTTKITTNDSTNKYTRQLSSEASEVTFTRENSNDGGRFKLTREESKMSILDYPINQDTNRKKREEPHASTNTLNKITHLRPKQIQQDQIKAICEAVLLKSQKKNEYTSLTNLDKIVNEGKETEPADYDIREKSASSGKLDAVDSSGISSSPLSVKKVINNFEAFPSPNTPRKLNNPIDNKPQTINKIDGEAEDPSSLSIHLSAVNTAKVINIVTEDDIYDNPLPRNKPLNSSESIYESEDDIYVDSPNNRPVSFDKENDEHINDVYDNPPNNRPVINSSDDHLDDIYVDPTNNRSVFNDAAVDKNDNQDNAKCEKNESGKDPSSQRKVKTGDETKGGDVYDFPPPFNRGIKVTSDDRSGYSLTLTSDKDPCFDSSYVNARSFNC